MMIYVDACREWILPVSLPPWPPLGDRRGASCFSARKLLTPTLWCLLELKGGSHETDLSGLHMALTGYCDLGLGLSCGGGQAVFLLREM